MAKVIKAGLARMAEPEKVKSKGKASGQPDDMLEALGLSGGDLDGSGLPDEDTDAQNEPADGSKGEGNQEQVAEAYQAAYDELIQAAQDEVAAMLDDARKEALTIMRESESHANSVREQAWEEGYKQAYEQGRRESADMLSKAQNEIDETLAQLADERRRMLEELEKQMLDIALEVAGKILHKELDNDDEAFLSMLRNAVAHVPTEDTVSIRLNTEEYERFFKSRETKLKTSRGPVDVKLVSDPSMERYGAVIESPSGIVDAGADAQFRQMKKNMGVEEDVRT